MAMESMIENIPKNFRTLNPVDGCDFGCEYCYAKKINHRFHWVDDWSQPVFFPERVNFKFKTPQIIFLNSMSDFAAWKPEWKDAVVQEVIENPQNRYLTITKRPELFIGNLPSTWYYGVTVTCKDDLRRIQVMKENVSYNHFHICFEPLFESLGEIDLDGIEWIEIGQETGNRKGKIVPEKSWVAEIRDQAKSRNIPIMMKSSMRKIVGDDIFECQFPFDIAKY